MVGLMPLRSHARFAQAPWGRNRVFSTSVLPGGRAAAGEGGAAAADVWIMPTGFGVVQSSDYGETWQWSSTGIAEVCMYQCVPHPTLANYT